MPTLPNETVIDGYNLIHILWNPETDGPMSRLREKLEELLSAYRKATRNHVTVVYDGGPLRGSRSFGTVEVVYSGSQSCADRWIIEYVKNLGPRSGHLTVVTGDREIRRQTIALGARCIDATGFASELHSRGLFGDPSSHDGETRKRGEKPLDEKEVQQWLTLFGGK